MGLWNMRAIDWIMRQGDGEVNFYLSIYGVIGKSGTFFPCSQSEHIETCLQYGYDSPFVCCYPDDVTFPDYYRRNDIKPTVKQFETLIDWCTANGFVFEEMIDCWSEPWEDFMG